MLGFVVGCEVRFKNSEPSWNSSSGGNDGFKHSNRRWFAFRTLAQGRSWLLRLGVLAYWEFEKEWSPDDTTICTTQQSDNLMIGKKT
jgi:hypothetical protein